MVNIVQKLAGWSSWLFRLCAYVFLRWIPGHHFPYLIVALMSTYIASHINGYVNGEPFQVILREETTKGKRKVHKEIPPASLRDKLFTIFSSIPNPVWGGSHFNFLINFCIFLCVGDMLGTSSFWDESGLQMARVGFVSHDRAKILIRQPFPTNGISINYRDASSDVNLLHTRQWQTAGVLQKFTYETDFTAHIELHDLTPDTRYEYQVGRNLTGFFRTAPPPGILPAWRNETFTFLFTSCMKARVPYRTWDNRLHIKGLELLADWIPKLNPSFMLFLGDFIYIDVPMRMGEDVETYRSEYRRVYASPSWPKGTEELPWIHVIDDHEIANDWDGNTTGVYQAAVDPFHHYHVAVNPDLEEAGETFSSFNQGPASFFMLESRRYRTPESKNATDPNKSMLGPLQLESLLRWIHTKPPQGVRFKFMASSVPFTSNWVFGATDTWGTYLHERQIILDAMHEASERHKVRFIVISGDRHEAAAVRFRDPDTERKGDVWEFSVSPLSMFYLPIRTFFEVEESIMYSPYSNFKWGAMEITQSTTDPEESILQFRLFKDGKETWTYTISSILGKDLMIEPLKPSA